MKAKKVTAVTGLDKKKSLEKLDSACVEYIELKGFAKDIEEKLGKWKPFISQNVKEMGTQLEGKKELETAHCKVQLVTRTSAVLSDEAESYLKERGLYSQATSVVLDVQKIEALFAQGKLNTDDMQVLLKAKTSEALYVNPK